MKPTPQISSDGKSQTRFPVTDYNFQTTLEAAEAVTERGAEVRETRAFWKLSCEVFAPKTMAEYLRELVAFAAVGALSAWSILTAMHAITRMVRNY